MLSFIFVFFQSSINGSVWNIEKRDLSHYQNPKITFVMRNTAQNIPYKKSNDQPNKLQLILNPRNDRVIIIKDHNAHERHVRPTSSNNVVKLTSYFNDQGYHTSAISLGAVFNGISRTVARQYNKTPITISTVNHPLPRTSHDRVAGKTSTDYRGFILAIHMMIGMAFLSGSFALFIVRERVVRAKHSQLVSGASVTQFWLSTFLWDMFNYMFPCIFLLILFACFNIQAYCGDHRLGLLLLLLLLYGWASLPLMYNLSMLFSVPSSAFVWLSMFNLISGK